VKKPNAKLLFELIGQKALTIPKEGWTAATFRRNGRPMIMAMHRASMLARKRNAAEVARRVATIFELHITETVERFKAVDRAMLRRRMVGRKASPLDIFLESDQRILEQIFETVIRESADKTRRAIIPPVQSVMDQGYSKTSFLLGQVPKEDNDGLRHRARNLADKITEISEPVRAKFRKLLEKAAEEKLSVRDTTRRILTEMPKVGGQRALTIARTELSNAWTQGAVQSFKESTTVTRVSVIGCESREEERWQQPSYRQFLYRGESTCNIQDVAVADADKLVFHPNHTGTMIPTGFVD